MFLSKPFFRDSQQRRLFWLSSIASLCCAALVFGRAWLNRAEWADFESHPESFLLDRAPTFFFLLWNLFLAWIPYWAALWLGHLDRRGRSASWKLALLGAAWLAFFPNAPYIVTDLVHLRHRPPVPLWFDLVAILSTALTGLFVGLLSLFEIQIFLQKRLRPKAVWAILIAAAGLGGFGVWLGRDQRWNSWDIIARPFALARDLVAVAAEPRHAARMLAVTALMSAFLLLSYLFLEAMIRQRKTERH